MLDRRCARLPSAHAGFSRCWPCAAGRWPPRWCTRRPASRVTNAGWWRYSAADHLLRNSGSASPGRAVPRSHPRNARGRGWRPTSSRRIHRALVRILTARGVDDPKRSSSIAAGAGDREAASHHAAAAARKAAPRWRSIGPPRSIAARSSWPRRSRRCSSGREALAEALDQCRASGAKRARSISTRPAAPTTSKRIELQRRAAEQFLIGGHIDRGMAVIGTVLGAVSMRLAARPACRGGVAVLWRRARLRWRGLDYRGAASRTRWPRTTLLRIDTCWSVVTGLALVDIIRAADFHTRHLALALDAGEPYRMARAMAHRRRAFSAATRPSAHASPSASSAGRHRMASAGHPHAMACRPLTSGDGRAPGWRVEDGDGATADRRLRILRERCAGTTWETTAPKRFPRCVLLFQGEIREVCRPAPGAAAGRQGPRQPVLRNRASDADEPGVAGRRPARRGRTAGQRGDGAWSHAGFHRQHYNHVFARIQTELIGARGSGMGDRGEPWQGWSGRCSCASGSGDRGRYLRARAALLMAASGRDARRFFSFARADARRIGHSACDQLGQHRATAGERDAHLEAGNTRHGSTRRRGHRIRTRGHAVPRGGGCRRRCSPRVVSGGTSSWGAEAGRPIRPSSMRGESRDSSRPAFPTCENDRLVALPRRDTPARDRTAQAELCRARASDRNFFLTRSVGSATVAARRRAVSRSDSGAADSTRRLVRLPRANDPVVRSRGADAERTGTGSAIQAPAVDARHGHREPRYDAARPRPRARTGSVDRAPRGGGAIRGIDEKFAVNPATGTGTLTIPIAATQGRSGFGPR